MKMVNGGQKDNGGSSCQALVQQGSNSQGTVVIEGLSSGAASSYPGMIHWCCDSCCTATWAYHDGCPS